MLYFTSETEGLLLSFLSTEGSKTLYLFFFLGDQYHLYINSEILSFEVFQVSLY